MQIEIGLRLTKIACQSVILELSIKPKAKFVRWNSDQRATYSL